MLEEDRIKRERENREEETKVKSVDYYVQQACFHCNGDGVRISIGSNFIKF